MAEPATSSNATAQVIAGQLRLSAGYLSDSRVLAEHKSRSAANLLFQATEAALLAVLTSEGQHAGRANQHQLGAMKDMLPDANPMKPLFSELEHLSGYATTFRYVTPAGRIKDGLSASELVRLQLKVDQIIETCRDWFGVNLAGNAVSPATRITPLRPHSA